MIAQTGAVMVFSKLPPDNAGRSRSLPASLVTKTNRPGEQLAEVGPNFKISHNACSVVSGTARSCQPFWLRACVKSWAMASSGRVVFMSSIKLSLRN